MNEREADWLRHGRFAAFVLAVYALLTAEGLTAALLPGVTLLRPHAATGFFLAAIGVLCASYEAPSLRRMASILGVLLLVDGMAMFLLGVTGGEVPAWLGPISPRAALILACAGGLLLLPLNWPWTAQALLSLAVLVAWVNVLRLLLGWAWLGIGPARDLVPPVDAVLAMGALVVALAGVGQYRGQWLAFYRGRKDRQLVAAGTLILCIVSVTIGMLGVSLAMRSALTAYDAAMQARVDENQRLVTQAIGQAVGDTRRAIGELGVLPADGEQAAVLRRLQKSLGAVRFQSVMLERADGGGWQVGPQGEADGPRLPLEAVSAELIWDTPPRLVVSEAVEFAHGAPGRLSVVTELPSWVSGVFANTTFGESGETLYGARVGERIVFLPTRFVPKVFSDAGLTTGDAVPMRRALDGEQGVVVAPDYRGVLVKAAFRPVAGSIGIVQKVDVAELLAPARAWTWALAGAILLVVLLGGFALNRALYPLAHALSRQERRHRAFLDSAPMAIVQARADGVIERVNSHAAQLLGRASGELPGMLLGSLLDQASIALQLRELAAGEELALCCGVRRANGELLPVEAHFRRDRVDGQDYLIATLDDRSEHLRRQRELETWESVFLNATWGIALGNPDGSLLLDLNPAFAHMHDYEREELAGRPMIDLCAPSARAGLATHIARACELGYYTFDSVHVRKDGSEFPVRIDVTVIYDDEGSARLRIFNCQDMTLRQEMERRLRESEQMRRMVLDTQRDLIVRYRPDSTVEFANVAYAALFGLSPDAIVGQRWLDLRRVQDARRAAEEAATLGELARRPRRVEQVSQIDHPQAGLRWLLWTTLPIYGDDGQCVGFQASGHDITARKLAEEALLESENWFRTLFESMFHHALVLDTSGRVVAVNRHAAAFLGRPRQALVGLLYWELGNLVEPGKAERLHQIVGRVSAGEEVRLEANVVSSQGASCVFDFSYRPIQERDGKLRHILVEAHDITAYRDQERRISEREARFQGVAESMPGVVFEFVHEGAGLIGIYANQAASTVLGVASEVFESEPDVLLDCLHPDDRNGFMNALLDCERRQGELRWVGRFARPEGGWLSIRARQRQVGNRLVWSGVGLDITEIKEKELEVERSRAALRDLAAHYEGVREDERRVMAREVHDELGQNLTALRMGLSVLAERSAGDALASEALRLKSVVDRSISVVRGIATSLRPAAMDLGIASALNWLANEFETNAQLPCSVEVDAAGIELDDKVATTLFRIAQESLTNIARHAQPSHVWIRMRRINRHVVLEVGDDGRGFEPGRRTGGGFGLLGMKERALSLGGEMQISSQPGEGTVVSIQIPLE